MTRIKTAVILAAGKGTRLDRPDRPKPLVRIGHKPLIEWTIGRLQRAGIEKIYVVVGDRGHLIRRELTGRSDISVPVSFVEQDDATDAGMLASIMSLYGTIREPFLVTVSDVISEDDPYRWVSTLEPGEHDIHSVVAVTREHFDRSGAHSRAVVGGDNRILRLGRELEPYDGLEVGVYYFGARALERLQAAREVAEGSVARFDELLNAHTKNSALFALFLGEREWYDVNTPATAVRAELFLRRKHYAYAPISGDRSRAELAVLPEAVASFSRNRRMESKVYIRRGLVAEAERVEIIPRERIRSPHYLLTDSVVDGLYGKAVHERLRRAGFAVEKLVMPAGEQAKNMETYLSLAERIFAYGLDEGSVLLNIGGGVVNNMAGALAATIYRGIGLIHIPTTTMAQFDAAIDFKQAVNHARGKNLIGAYHPAFRILIDPDTLVTLPDRHIRNGFAESLKHALTQDKKFYEYFVSRTSLFDAPEFLEEVALRTVECKVPLLSGDTANEYNEMAPQYGHSVGHAVEHLSGYELLHGEAVAIGCSVSAEVAKILGVSDAETAEAHYALFEQYGLPTRVPDSMTAADVIDAIRYDKHYLAELPRMSLVDRIGSLWHDKGTYAIPIDYAVLERAINANKSRRSHSG